MELGLKGRNALVTGSSRGIGRGIALALASEGCDVTLTGRDRAALDDTAAIKKCGARAAIAVIDLREQDAAERLIGQVKSEFGGLDILVNNAGATKRGDFLKLTDADWADGYALKFFAHVRLARAAWPLLKERRGALISIGGTGGRKPTAEFTIGSSVNAAVAAFTKCLADRGKTDGVRVNCIHPSIVETDRTRRRIKAEIERTGAPEQKIREQLLREFNNPIRIGSVEDVGSLVVFTVSSRAVGCTAPPSISTAVRFRCCEQALRLQTSRDRHRATANRTILKFFRHSAVETALLQMRTPSALPLDCHCHYSRGLEETSHEDLSPPCGQNDKSTICGVSKPRCRVQHRDRPCYEPRRLRAE